MNSEIEEIRADIERLDRGQLHIISRLDRQDKELAEQTKMLKPISDYFVFGRITKGIVVALAGLAAFVAAIVAVWKDLHK